MELAWCKSEENTAYGLLKKLYESQTGKPLPAIEKTPLGKPYFMGVPLHFSISHTPGHAFCCIHEETVGLDAEEIGRPIDLRLAHRYCSPAERERVFFSPNPQDALLRLWVLKESYGKFLGKGLGNYLVQTDFSPDDPRIQVVDGCYLAVFTQERK